MGWAGLGGGGRRDRVARGPWLPIAIAVVCVGGSGAIARPAAAQTAAGEYPPGFEATFTESCTMNAMRSAGLTPEVAERYCGCAVSSLQSNYTFEEALAIYERVGQSRDGSLPDEFLNIATQCLQQVLAN